MKYPHIVVKSGIWYPAGAEVPEDAVVAPANEEQAQEQPKRGRKSKEA